MTQNKTGHQNWRPVSGKAKLADEPSTAGRISHPPGRATCKADPMIMQLHAQRTTTVRLKVIAVPVSRPRGAARQRYAKHRRTTGEGAIIREPHPVVKAPRRHSSTHV